MTKNTKTIEKEFDFKVGDKVLYCGVEVEQLCLYAGVEYEIAELDDDGNIKPFAYNFFFKSNQFVLSDKNSSSVSFKKPDNYEFLQEEKSESKIKERKEMKFNVGPGGAVVYYKAGSHFHIFNLEGIILDHVGHVRLICITRTYDKDGISFTQRADIPVEMIDKIVYFPKDTSIDKDSIVITYDEDLDSLTYSITRTTTINSNYFQLI